MQVWAWDAGLAPWASSAMTRAAPNIQATAKASGECIGTGIIGKFRWLDKVERREIRCCHGTALAPAIRGGGSCQDRKSTRLNSSHGYISYAVFCLKKKKKI